MHPSSNFNSNSARLSFELGHGWLIISTDNHVGNSAPMLYPYIIILKKMGHTACFEGHQNIKTCALGTDHAEYCKYWIILFQFHLSNSF